MQRKTWSWMALALVSLVACVVVVSRGEAPGPGDLRMFERQFQDGNFLEAYTGLRNLCLRPTTPAADVPRALRTGVQCLQRLGRIGEIDEFLAGTVKAHAKNWRLLLAAAEEYEALPHQGSLIADKFQRGQDDGTVVSTFDRDHVRALQLAVQAIPLAQNDDRKDEVGAFFLALANMLRRETQGQGEWRLQSLTDLAQLPDYEEGYPYFDSPPGAPVDAEGRPVFYTTPDTWEAAASDGQRWRWALSPGPGERSATNE